MARHFRCRLVLLGKLSGPPSVSKVVFLPRIRVLWPWIVGAFQGLWQNKGNWLCALGGILHRGWVDSEQAGPAWVSPPCLVAAAEWGRVGLWQLLIWEVFGSRPLPEVLFHYGCSTYLYTDFHCFPICALHTFLALWICLGKCCVLKTGAVGNDLESSMTLVISAAPNRNNLGIILFCRICFC